MLRKTDIARATIDAHRKEIDARPQFIFIERPFH